MQDHPHGDRLHHLAHIYYSALLPLATLISADLADGAAITLQVLPMEAGHQQLAPLAMGVATEQNCVVATQHSCQQFIHLSGSAE